MDTYDELPVEIDVEDVKRLLDERLDVLLLDCRSSEEHAQVQLSGAQLIPWDEVEHRVSEITPYRDRQIVVFCHHGRRSQLVCDWLRAQGFSRVQSMRGGIDSWAVRIDPSLPRY